VPVGLSVGLSSTDGDMYSDPRPEGSHDNKTGVESGKLELLRTAKAKLGNGSVRANSGPARITALP
jgi:hypothetical protein